MRYHGHEAEHQARSPARQPGFPISTLPLPGWVILKNHICYLNQNFFIHELCRWNEILDEMYFSCSKDSGISYYYSLFLLPQFLFFNYYFQLLYAPFFFPILFLFCRTYYCLHAVYFTISCFWLILKHKLCSDSEFFPCSLQGVPRTVLAHNSTQLIEWKNHA